MVITACLGVCAQAGDALEATVDSIYDQMSMEERVGQLFMIRAHSDLGPEHIRSVREQISKYHVGGLCFFQGTPAKHAELINSYQELSEFPLMIAIDAEWGGGMRFKESAMSFPRQLTLGAIQDNSLIYDMGVEVGRQLKQLGIHVNFAPVVDVNNNPRNPVINDRSFGEDRYDVTAKGYQYMKGMQDAGIMACAKHFPGHGDTDVDSHLDLPVINHDVRRLDSVELYPFKVMIDKGLQSIMVAHLNVPAYDPTSNLPTTLSPYVVDTLLRGELGFDGLVFTDALEMKGVTKHHSTDDIMLKALNAGNDMLVLPENMGNAFAAVMNAASEGRVPAERLEESVKRILRSKVRLGMLRGEPADLNADMFPGTALGLKQQLYEKSLTVVANSEEVLPIRDASGKKITSLMIGQESRTAFQKRLNSYSDAKHISVTQEQLPARKKALLDLLAQQDLVVVGVSNLNKYASKNFGLRDETVSFIRQLDERANVILVVFGSPYALMHFDNLPTVVMAYESDPMMQDVAAQALFGAIASEGRLPVTSTDHYALHHGVYVPSLGRLGYSVPERTGMSSDSLEKISSIVDEMISKRAAPGCQVLVARHGKVIYNRSFGSHTYNKKIPVKNTDLYDVASVTKVASTTIAAMQLYEQQKLFPRQSLDYYLDDVANTNKEHLRISDIMAHRAGLQPWLPFHENTVRRSGSAYEPSPEHFRNRPEGEFTVPVAEDLYLINSQADTIWQLILDSPLRRRGSYKYSDIGFYMIATIIERQSGLRLDQYCDKHFYEPLGLERTCFLPLRKFTVDEITPTEEDRSFRKQRLQGHVHDSNSAMLGGVGGHAGLFSNAEGLAVIMQMLLNGGTYGGTRFIENETIEYFATRVRGSTRRGLGFDMKELNSANNRNTADQVSDGTYGHTGFTGTCVWNDPENELVFVFLSNRTYPSSRRNNLARLNIRERVQEAVYNAIEN